MRGTAEKAVRPVAATSAGVRASAETVKKPAARRTQEERRNGTMGKLMDATINSILVLGYARTTVCSICERAGVSQGGLFRHFNSVMELIIAAAESTPDPLVAALYALRQSARESVNAVIYELYVAAKTNPELRGRMSDFMDRFAVAVVESSMHFSALRGLSQEKRLLILSSLLHLFDGEALVQPVFTQPGLDELRMKWLIQMIRDLTE